MWHAKKTVQGVVVVSWVVLWLVAVGLNGWKLEIESRASMAVSSLACFIMASVPLAMLFNMRARQALAASDADVARAWLSLLLFSGGFAYVGVVMLVSALG